MDPEVYGDISEFGRNGSGPGDLFANISTDPAAVYRDQVYTVADALEPEPETTPLVDGVFTMAGISMMFGAPGSLKSMVAMDLGVCVASGTNFLPSHRDDAGNDPGMTTTQAPVLWCDQDTGRVRVKQRLAALIRGHELEAESVQFYFLAFPNPAIAAASRAGLDALTANVKELRAGLVVFDNYLSTAGVRDENSSENIAAVNALHRLTDETGALALAIHHPTKTSLANDLNSLRGHGSIAGGLDGALLVTRPDKGDIIKIESVKDRDNPIATFAARWVFSHARDGRTLYDCRFYRAEVPDPQKVAREMLRLEILAALEKDQPLNQTEIVDVTGKRKANVVATLKELVNIGDIKLEKGARGAKVYRLA